MKSFNGFIRTTLAGGILFLIPLIILLSVVRKAMDIINRLTAPWMIG